MTKVIDRFEGKYAFLSNFYPVNVTLDGEIYPSVEHAYQAAKTLDKAERQKIQKAETAAKAKKLGRKVTMRSDWEDQRLPTMTMLLKQKFKAGTLPAGLLKGTGKAELVEGNWWGDTFWGVCKGQGENHLGKILMEVRDGK